MAEVTVNLRSTVLRKFLLNKGEIFELSFTFPETYPSLIGVTGSSDIKADGVGSVVDSNMVEIDAETRTVTVTLPADVSATLEDDVEYVSDLRLEWSASDVKYPAAWKFAVESKVTA
jgi:hypothetical protein